MRIIGTSVLALAAAAVAGCSPDFSSVDDVYVPQSVQENFPITVVEKPVKLTLDVGAGGLDHDGMNEVAEFGRAAAAAAKRSDVSISYPRNSKPGRRAADQAAGVLVRNGVGRPAIRISNYEGKSNVVTLSYSAKVATTRPCGDWSENLVGKYTNSDLGPNFGCSVQQNFAAMVTNPEDFVHPHKAAPPLSAPQSVPLEAYKQGVWTVPVVTSDSSSSSSSSSGSN